MSPAADVLCLPADLSADLEVGTQAGLQGTTQLAVLIQYTGAFWDGVDYVNYVEAHLRSKSLYTVATEPDWRRPLLASSLYMVTQQLKVTFQCVALLLMHYDHSNGSVRLSAISPEQTCDGKAVSRPSLCVMACLCAG